MNLNRRFFYPFIFLLVLNIVFTSSFAQEKHNNILAHIDAAIQTMPKQKTFVYSYVSWCGGNMMDVNRVDSVLLTKDKCYNFILLVNGNVD